ncbi:MAG: glycosyltransferase N-terminal domain-containing protein [Gemmatimonadota bacterium]|nr:glycosyltransferase N-terminal domain-containing protein [Gemmatimonadota bacterium]MDQ8166191.1 glycosyltransferase N-terminal domain-containing protein [Gemmatimonadota bacterium]
MWRSFAARRGLTARVAAAAHRVRTPSRPLVWMHAPSVGEGLQARPVAHALRTRHPEVQLAYTFFSPSAEPFAPTIGADITDYLPFDSARDADAMLDALQPTVLVFVKLDVWPTLVARAAARNIPVALLSGTVAPRSGRRGLLSRLLLRDAYAALQGVGAIDAGHAERLRELGVRPAVLEITGDTRFDQVWAKAERVDRAQPLLQQLAGGRPTLVAGSTWPADEAVLLPAFAALVASWPHDTPAPRLIIAPHEPTAAHLAPLLDWARQGGLRAVTLSDAQTMPSANASEDTVQSGHDVIVVDRVGVLGDLYALADVAYVGGGFHAAGLHSVIEPAAFGVPVLFGPRHDMSREAGLLLAAGGAVVAHDRTALIAALHQWFDHADVRAAAGHAARDLVARELGATERSVQLVQRLLHAPR